MENLIISLACISIMLFGAVSMSTSSLHSIDMVCTSWKDIETKITDRSNTDIEAMTCEVSDDGDVADMVVKNIGNTSLAEFERWDVIVMYGDGGVYFLPYGQTTPGWSLGGISFEGHPETFEPNIVNPGEEMSIIAKLSPPVSENITNMATISTFNGVKTQIMFSR